ncbi:MAG: flagellar basal-body rod protein FlgB [Candidatus Eremiobacteraeota bacterium]|jgi:flagellar basal-body rod protein FlgB|nr:flagellar basal-body rod protein FlgB [Candidatus Eremiobacteraeota bacterium]
MGDISFGQTVGMLKDAMSGSAEAHAVMANNIANANTPNFRRSDVSFKEALAATEATQGDPDQLALTTTSDRHIAIGGPQDSEPFAVTTSVDDTQQMRVDGSNVDVDQEMAKLSLNSAYAQTMGQLLTNQYSRLRQAIQERF